MPRRKTYPRRTPLGALLIVEPFANLWHWVSIDRIPVGDATAPQQATASAFSEAAAQLAIAQGYPGGVPHGGGLVIWHAAVPNQDVDRALEAYFALEQNQPGPLTKLTAEFSARAATKGKDGRTYLYRLFGTDDDLLYVGISLSALGRLGQHLNEKDWAPQVCRTTIESYPTRDAASDAERAAIRSEQPRYNKIHNTRREQGWRARDMPDVCQDSCSRQYADDTIYFPKRWADGVAHYSCDRGHEWTCGWGHKGSGSADLPPMRVPSACAHGWLEPQNGSLVCCDCGVSR